VSRVGRRVSKEVDEEDESLKLEEELELLEELEILPKTASTATGLAEGSFLGGFTNWNHNWVLLWFLNRHSYNSPC